MALTGQRYGHELRPEVRPRRLRAALLGLATFLTAGVVTAAVMLVVHPLHSGRAPVPTNSAPARPAQEQAARGLAGLLTRSVADRSSIVAAVNDVSRCGPNLRQDPRTLQAAVASRRDLLGRLTRLPGRSALPPVMLAALKSAWLSSIKADQYYLRWARDEISRGCAANSSARAAAGPDAQATAGKETFVGVWNPIATRYGLPTYRWNQL